MLRMTLALVVSLYAAMSIWGEPQGDDVAVARADNFVPAMMGLAPRPRPKATADSALSDIGERDAVRMALAAGSRPEAPEPLPTAAAPEPKDNRLFFYVSGSRVNLRGGPTTKSPIVGTATMGDRAEVLSDTAASWVQIRTEGGVEAWIYGRFLSETPA